MRIRMMLVFCAALALTVGVATATGGGGNSGNAKQCQKLGWQGLVTSTGLSFESEGACVSYAARGGTLMPKPLPPAACPCSLWSNAFTPTTPATTDTAASSRGVRFRSDVPGFVTGIRFYKGTGNNGTHVGNVWTANGTLLASATFTGETATGWQQVNFSSPVAINANTFYIASYKAPLGHYSLDQSYFSTAYDNAPLHAPADGADSANGVFGPANGFPTSSSQASNYWVDVVFVTS